MVYPKTFSKGRLKHLNFSDGLLYVNR